MPGNEIEDFRNDLNSFELEALCLEISKDLNDVLGLNKQGILYAIAGVETSYCKNNIPKIETAYMPRGKYFNKQMAGLYATYGGLVSCSYGPWQIMAVKAYELGYKGHPLRLWDGNISGPYVIQVLNSIIKQGATTVEQVLDAYNTGSFRLGEPPQNYICRFWNFYQHFIEKELS